MAPERLRSFVLLHFTVILFGFTGILGKYLTDSIPSGLLVWYRMMIAFASIGIWLAVSGKSFKTTPRNLFNLFFIGALIAFHWIFFFESIHVSNVSVPLACLSSGAFFTALIEPIFYKRKIAFYEVWLGLLVIAALVLIFKFETNYQKGIVLSLISSFLGSLFTVINGLMARDQDPATVSFYEMIGGFILLTGYLAFTAGLHPGSLSLSFDNFLSLMVLGVVCTGFAFVAMVNVMKVLSPFTVTLTINLEPIYAIVLAFFLFDEYKYLTTEFFIGAFVILCTVILNAILKGRKKEPVGQTAE